jgi:DNA-binding MarR family transcriptional regulator
MDRSTLGRLLRPLQRRHLVTLAIDPRDRRSRTVALTATGRRTVGNARPLWAVADPVRMPFHATHIAR